MLSRQYSCCEILKIKKKQGIVGLPLLEGDDDMAAAFNSGNVQGADVLFAVRHTLIERLPFAEDIEEFMPPHYKKVYTESVEDGFSADLSFPFARKDDLVPLYYEKHGEKCPIAVKPFDELLEQTVTGVDGEPHFIDSYENYLGCYGIDFENICWIRSVPVFACVATNEASAERFIEENRGVLNAPEIVPFEAGRTIPAGQTARFPS